MTQVEKYNFNGEILNFILHFEKIVEKGQAYTNKELVELFEASRFYDDIVESYYKTAVQKSVWYAVNRSESWDMKRGIYIKL